MSRCMLAASAALACLTGAIAPASAQDTEPFIAQVIWLPYTFCPLGWTAAQGQLLSIASNTALFSLIGTTYGGDGRTTFALPDLRGRAVMGDDQGPGLSPRTLGEKAGAETGTLTTAQMPQHTHAASTSIVMRGTTTASDDAAPGGNVPGNGGVTRVYVAGAANVDMAPGAVAATTSVAPAGSSLPFSNMQPSLTLLPCIATQGIFPSRP